jgi:16S rRNA A1518/A1519 N6-dimethyltransferase RsmA/KsgA/DIM1 with predicted DNA glycosylase/AP lyase activity
MRHAESFVATYFAAAIWAEVIAAAGFDANVRGETLSIPEFARIANEIVRRKNNG